MSSLRPLAAAFAVVLLLACGGGAGPLEGVTATALTAPEAPKGPPVRAAYAGAKLTGPWEWLAPEIGQGEVDLCNDQMLSVFWPGGDLAGSAAPFVALGEKAGWPLTDQDDDPDYFYRRFGTKSEGLEIAAIPKGGRVLVTAQWKGQGATKLLPPEALPKPEAEGGGSSGPVNCNDRSHKCESSCSDRAWKAKNDQCGSVTSGGCVDAVDERESACKRGCDEKRWACEKSGTWK